MSKVYLSAAEVAEALGVNPRTIYRMAEDRSVPFIRVRRQLRFRLEDVVRSLEPKR